MKRFIILFALILFGCQSEYDRAYTMFLESDYLNKVWNETCIYPLANRSYLMFMAKIEKSDDFYISCIRGESYDPLALSDVRSEWDVCGKEPDTYDGFAYAVYREIHYDPYPLVHLGNTIPKDEGRVAYILAKNCHTLGEPTPEQREICPECETRSAAYAVLDKETGEIYW